MNTVRIVIEPAAKQDIREARDYYADKGENTAIDFRDELNRSAAGPGREQLSEVPKSIGPPL